LSLLSAHPPSNTLPLLFLLESTSAAGCDLLLHLTNTSWSGLSFTANLSPCAFAGRLDLCIALPATCCVIDQLRSPGLTPQGQHTIAHSSSGDLWSTRTLATGLTTPRGVFLVWIYSPTLESRTFDQGPYLGYRSRPQCYSRRLSSRARSILATWIRSVSSIGCHYDLDITTNVFHSCATHCRFKESHGR
jgi:hypothetical protein